VKPTDSNVAGAIPALHPPQAGFPHAWAMVVTFVLYPIFASGVLAHIVGAEIGLIAAGFSWVLAIHLIFGVGWLAWQGSFRMLIAGGVAGTAAMVTAAIATGSWMPLGQWLVVLFGGSVFGRRLAIGERPLNAFITVGVFVSALMVAQLVIIWPQLSSAIQTMTSELAADSESYFRSMGYGAEAVQKSVEQTQIVLNAIVRLLPSLMVMSVLAQLAIGFLILMHLISKRLGYSVVPPFVAWKTPFLLAPAVIIAVALRLVGNESAEFVGDNMLALLAVCYCIGGLALMEYYLIRARFGRVAKSLFYIALFFTQMMGFAVTALVGFFDSFVDFRARHVAAEKK
jgi:Predicted membrane protein (DUF2232)